MLISEYRIMTIIINYFLRVTNVLLLFSFGWVSADVVNDNNIITEQGYSVSASEYIKNNTPYLSIEVVKNNNVLIKSEHKGLSLTPESELSKLMIISNSDSSFLFVKSYSGGAHCCWSLLVYDLNKKIFIGEMLRSYSSISLNKVDEDCLVRAKISPSDIPSQIEPQLYPVIFFCFDSGVFKLDNSLYANKIYKEDLHYYYGLYRDGSVKKDSFLSILHYYLTHYPNNKFVIGLLGVVGER